MSTDATTEARTPGGVDSARGWLMAAATFISTFVVFGVAYSFGAFFESMSDEFGSGKGLTALLFSLTTFLYFVLGLWTGRWSDRSGPRPVLLTAIVALGAGLLLTSVAGSIWVGLVTYSSGIGIAVACGYVPMVAAVGGWFDRHRTTALGVAVAGIGTGTLVVAPLSSWLIDEYGWRSAYRLLAVGGMALLAICVAIAAPPPVSASSEPLRPIRELFSMRSFRIMFFSGLLMSLALFVPFVFLASYAEERGVSSGLAATLVGLIGGASIVGRLGLGALAGTVGLLRLYQACFATMGASFVIWLAAGSSYAALVVFTIVLGVAYGGFIALSPAVAAHLFGTVGLGGVLGAVYTAAGLGGLIGPPLAGALIDATDGYTLAISAAVAMTVGAFAVLLPLTSDER